MGQKLCRGMILGVLCALTLTVPALVAAPAGIFDGKPTFSEGEGRAYYVWRDGDRWHLRWTTFGSMHRFSGSVVAEGGEIDSLKRIDVDSERHVVAPGRAPRVVRGPRGRVRGVRPGRAAVVATREQDHINKESDHRIVFNTRTDDDIDGFDFKVDKNVRALRFALEIDGQSQARSVEAGRGNARVPNNPFIVELR